MSSDSSAGTSFTINEAGVYYIYLSGHILWSTNQHLAVSLVKNSVVQESTDSLNSLGENFSETEIVGGIHLSVSAVVYLSVGDVVRPIYSTATPATNTGRFEIRRVH